jgi:hypothetical protein
MPRRYVVIQKDKDVGTVICTRSNLKRESKCRAVASELEKIGMKDFYRRYVMRKTRVGFEIRYKNTPGIIAVVVDAGAA